METSLVVQDFGKSCPVLPENDNLWTDARQLHTALQSRQLFANWFKGRVKKYGFKEGIDFKKSKDSSLINLLSSKKQMQQRKDYWISINMAKHLAMVENNEIGRMARNYFIECEKLAKLTNVKCLPALHEEKENSGMNPYDVLKCTWTFYKEIGLTGKSFAIAADRAHKKVLGYSAIEVGQLVFKK